MSNSIPERTADYLKAEEAAKNATVGSKWKRQIQLEPVNKECLKAEVGMQ